MTGATTREVVVLGAGYAGLRCAMRLGWRDPAASITVVDARATLCERVRLHQVASGQAVPQRDLAAMCATAGIGFRHARAERIDAAARVVHTDGGELRYDRLVLALGSHTDLSTPGAREHCDRVADEAGAHALQRRIAALPDGATVIVVGGGLTGIETACEVAQAWPQLHVSLVTKEALGDGLLGASGVRRLRASLQRLGVTVRDRIAVASVARDRLHTDTGTIPFHVCVWTPGFRAPALARESGLPVDAAGRLRVDASLRCREHPEIYGIGDAAIPDAPEAPMLMSCRLALPMAAHAADNLEREGRGAKPSGFVATDMARCISLGRDDALLQFHRKDGALRNLAFGGAVATWLKERICRFTVWILEHEARASARARRPRPALHAATAEP